MSYNPDPLQELILFRLAVSEEGGEFLKNIETTIGPAKRKPLVREQLVDEDRRTTPVTGRQALYLELTDKGWAWCQQHLGEELKSSSKLAGKVLERLLGLMKQHFESGRSASSFGQFVLQAQKAHRDDASSEETDRVPPKSIEGNGWAGKNGKLVDSIRRACLDLSGGRDAKRVRLADLRKRVKTGSRAAVDKALLEMETAGELTLYPLENPGEITTADKEAVLRTPTGQERHIIYYGGAKA